MDALDAVRGTIADLSRFCDRNPDLCTTGGEIVQVVADKARYGLDQIQGLLDNDGVAENTLTADDATIPWQGEDPPIVATAD